MSKTTLVLIAGFIAGCGAAVVAPLIIPPAHAQTTQRWESYCVGQNEDSRADDAASSFARIAAAAGREGWEPYAITSTGSSFLGVICFKRPAP